MEQNEDVLKPYYKTIRALLQARHEKDILRIFRDENMEGVWYNHDNWNGGIDFYQLQINVSPFIYDNINQDDVRTKLLDLFKQVIPIENIVVGGINIIPDVSVGFEAEDNATYSNDLKIFVAFVDNPYIYDKDVAIQEFPCLVLLANDWDDYDMVASFGLSYYDSQGIRHFIGKVKIIGDVPANKFGRRYVYKSIESGLFDVGAGKCSLGQTMDYYRQIKNIFGDKYLDVLYALRDCSVFPRFAKDFETNTWLYKKCLLRKDEAERTKREAPYMLNGIDLNDKYSFGYLFKPSYADERIKLHFDFSNNGILPNRLYAIIGKNGVGKTQFISTSPMCIYKKERSCFEPHIPLFSKVIAVSNCPFDHFEIPHETVEFQYVYCGMSVMRNGVKTILSDEDIKDKLHENLKEIKRCDRLEHLRIILKPLFSENELDEIVECDSFAKEEFWLAAVDEKYEKFSSGQNTFLYLFSSVIANIRYDSLLLFDEPETHLHPNAITLLMTSINLLLEKYESYGIIVTHSPLIIKELFARNVYIMRRIGNIPSVKRIGMESFGENLTNITEEVFDNKEITPYYYIVLKRLVDDGMSYEDIIRHIQSENIPVSLNLTILLESLVESRKNEKD